MKKLRCRTCGKDMIKFPNKISEEIFQLSGLCKECFSDISEYVEELNE